MKHPLLKKVEEVDGNLKTLREAAGPAYAALQAAQAKVAEVPADQLKDDHPDYVALDEAGKKYGELADQVAAAERVKAGITSSLAQQGIADPTDEERRNAHGRESADLTAEQRGQRRATAGQRIVTGEEYAELTKAGTFGKSRIGDQYLGAGLDRDELKAALITGADDSSAGAFVQPDRIGYYPLYFRPLTVLDLITIGDTDSDLIEFVRMLTFANAAAETPEALSAATIGDGTGGTVTALQGGRKPESGMTFETVQEAVSTIAHWIPATKRALADAGQLRTIIDGALRWGLAKRLEDQIIAGDGIGENLLGMLNTTGLNHVPAGPENRADKVHKGITQCRLDGFEPTGVVLNPLDAEAIRLMRENAAGDGAYLFGSPATAGQMTLWGLPVAQAAGLPVGTGVVGALQAFICWLREGTQVLASDSHMDFFTRNLVAVLAELRAGAGLPTPQAIADVDFAAA